MVLDWERISKRMKRRRRSLGLTQAELGGLVGVSKNTITRIEIGNRRPSIYLLERLADTFGCSIRSLLAEF